MRGGSYLCHDSYCHRYRVAARIVQHPGVDRRQHRLPLRRLDDYGGASRWCPSGDGFEARSARTSTTGKPLAAQPPSERSTQGSRCE